LDSHSRDQLDSIADGLSSSLVADVLDQAGYRAQVMRPGIRPLYPGAKVVGRAATMLAVEVREIPAEPYALLMELLDDLRSGEVVVAAVQGDPGAAIWGELLSTHTRARGGRGAVLDGLSRDSATIAEMRFPVFATGVSPADSKGRLEVIAIRSTIPAGGVAVANGDLVVADDDGCVVVPAAVEEQVVSAALEKASAENTIRDLLRQGSSLRQVFREHGIL
jgi:4-hydroxy-4-methyl-2-oxoglutarate aldolase